MNQITKYSLVLVMACAVFVPASVAMADDETGTEPAQSAPSRQLPPKPRPSLLPRFFGPNASTTRDDIREHAKELRDERRQGSTTPNQLKRDLRGPANGLVNAMKQFVRLLEAHVDRANGIIERLTQKADELDQKGVSTTEGRGHLAEATAELEDAQADIDALKALAETTTGGDGSASTTASELKTKFHDARELMKSARDHLKEAMKHIREALKAFRESVKQLKEANEHASSTSESN